MRTLQPKAWVRDLQANKAVFWSLVAFTLLLLYVLSYGLARIFASAPLREHKVNFLFTDEAGHGVQLDSDNSSANHFRENVSKFDQEIRTVKIDVSYLDDFAKIGMKREPFDESKLKTILVWNSGYESKTEGLTADDPLELERAGCPQPNCVVVSNRSRLPITEYDALIFHFRATRLNDLPRERSPSQRWIFKEIEPAAYVEQSPHNYDGLMNWTYTYRLDSDIPVPYGRIARKNPTDSQSPMVEPALNKTKMAAWFVSNCNAQSGRDAVVTDLRKYMKVDIFGKCSINECRQDQNNSCYKLLEKYYKFYLSFENSLCKDYVTEKLFNVLQYRVVPVVYGSADYATMVPPHSYISVHAFPKVSKLAAYLHYLDGNDTAYQEYFKWKDDYEVVDEYRLSLERICHMCLKLHSDRSSKVYKDIDMWFVGNSTCKNLSNGKASGKLFH